MPMQKNLTQSMSESTTPEGKSDKERSTSG